MSATPPEWLKEEFRPGHYCTFPGMWGLSIEPVWGRKDGMWVGTMSRWDDHKVIGIYPDLNEALERARGDASRWLQEDG